MRVSRLAKLFPLLAVSGWFVIMSLRNPSPTVSGSSSTLDTIYLDLYDPSDDMLIGPVSGNVPLVGGNHYLVTISGTWSEWYPYEWSSVCKGIPEDAPQTPSPDTTNGKVGIDPEYLFASPSGRPPCSDPEVPAPWTHNRIEFSLDGGTTWSDPAPIDPTYNPSHAYTYLVEGEGLPALFRYVYSAGCCTSDNYGVLTLTIDVPPVAFGTILSPTPNSTFGPTTLLFSATAQSNIGAAIQQVEFLVFYDRVWHAAGIDTTAPFEVVWQTPSQLRSQQLEFGIHIVDDQANRVTFADIVTGVNYLESFGNPDVAENWIPTRAYLNQRSLEPDGDSKCSAASMAMVLAMNSLTAADYATVSAMANIMYPRVLNADGDAHVGLMASELERQGMLADEREYSAPNAWSRLKQEIDAGRPVIVRTAHGVVTQNGHFFVAVGYREAVGSNQVIAYDPYGRWLGTCCAHNYDENTSDPESRKGQWVSYDFDLAFGPSNWLLTARPTTVETQPLSAKDLPTTPPDLLSDEPEAIGTYVGVIIQTPKRVFLPLTSSE